MKNRNYRSKGEVIRKNQMAIIKLKKYKNKTLDELNSSMKMTKDRITELNEQAKAFVHLNK